MYRGDSTREGQTTATLSWRAAVSVEACLSKQFNPNSLHRRTHTHTHKLNYLFHLPTAYKLEMLLPCQLFNFFYQERIINICPNLFSLAFCSQIRRISRVSSHWGGWPLSICPPKTDFCWHLVLGK